MPAASRAGWKESSAASSVGPVYQGIRFEGEAMFSPPRAEIGTTQEGTIPTESYNFV